MKLSGKQWLCIIGLIGVFIILNSTFFWKLIFPIHYEEEVMEASEYFEVDPHLVLAVVQIESNFKQNRSSKKGATGLMQLMPDTAEWANVESGLNTDPSSYIEDPKSNILLGTWYLSYLHNKYNGDMTKTIAAYNAGQGHVDRWLNEGKWDGSEYRLDQIPFGETRHYVSRVLYYYYHYKEVYDIEKGISS
jgi:soluble lytic murein transglycosylase